MTFTHTPIGPGAVVGDYEIVRQLDERGGMAVVFLASQSRLGRTAALKQVDVHGGEEFVARFVREARLAGSLNHPNVVTVYDFFEHDDVPYIAMEFLERGSLRPWIGRTSLAQTVGVLEGALAGLTQAHAHGVVHRDIKPENILVSATGAVKVADFGIARAADATAYLTKTGMTVGTCTYMAPEQAMNKQIGPQTDLYALGVVAYELFLGRPPFLPTGVPMAALFQHVNDPIPAPRSIKPDLDPDIAAWLERMLAKPPEDRPLDTQAAWEELEDAAVRLLGPMWRRDARLTEPEAGPPAAGTRPLTPAPFTAANPVAATEPSTHEPTVLSDVEGPADSYLTFIPSPPLRPPTHDLEPLEAPSVPPAAVSGAADPEIPVRVDRAPAPAPAAAPLPSPSHGAVHNLATTLAPFTPERPRPDRAEADTSRSRPAPPRRGRRRLLTAAAAVGSAAVVTVGMSVFGHRSSDPSSRAVATTPEATATATPTPTPTATPPADVDLQASLASLIPQDLGPNTCSFGKPLAPARRSYSCLTAHPSGFVSVDQYPERSQLGPALDTAAVFGYCAGAPQSYSRRRGGVWACVKNGGDDRELIWSDTATSTITQLTTDADMSTSSRLALANSLGVTT